MFRSELEMSKKFETFLKGHVGSAYFKECKGFFGIPDFVHYRKDGNDIVIVSFELKLQDWRRAVTQAFRYRSFSHMSFVVLSAENSDSVRKNLDLFERYNIGLATFDKQKNFQVLFRPIASEPYSELLKSKMVHEVELNGKRSRKFATFFD